MTGAPGLASCETAKLARFSAFTMEIVDASVTGAVSPQSAMDIDTTGIPALANSITASTEPFSNSSGQMGHCMTENSGLLASASSPPATRAPTRTMSLASSADIASPWMCFVVPFIEMTSSFRPCACSGPS